MEFVWLLLALVFVPIFYFFSGFFKTSYGTNHAKIPSPPALPIIGHFHLLGRYPHRSILKICQKYGPLVQLQLGSIPVIFASSPEMAKEILKTKDHVFASRAPFFPAKLAENKNLIFTPYGDYLRRLRALCAQELLSSKVVASFQSSRKEEMNNLLGVCLKASKDAQPLHVRKLLSQYTYNTLSQMLMGRTFLGPKNPVETEEIKQFKIMKSFIETVVFMYGKFLVTDYFPFMQRFIWEPAVMKQHAEEIYKFWRKFIQQKRAEPSNDFMSSLLSYRPEVTPEEADADARHAVVGLMSAGTDAVSTTIEWAVAELLQHPHCLQKLRQEIESVVGKDRLVEESDLEELKYLQAVIKETFRLHAPVPLSIVHMGMEDQYIANYFVPKGTRIFVNLFGIGRNPEVWENPDLFSPERFIDSENSIEPLGHDFELIPFGSGRRSCPGMALAFVSAPLMIANLVHAFDWKVVSNTHCFERFGFVAPMEDPLQATPSPRLENLENAFKC